MGKTEKTTVGRGLNERLVIVTLGKGKKRRLGNARGEIKKKKKERGGGSGAQTPFLGLVSDEGTVVGGKRFKKRKIKPYSKRIEFHRPVTEKRR